MISIALVDVMPSHLRVEVGPTIFAPNSGRGASGRTDWASGGWTGVRWCAEREVPLAAPLPVPERTAGVESTQRDRGTGQVHPHRPAPPLTAMLGLTCETEPRTGHREILCRSLLGA